MSGDPNYDAQDLVIKLRDAPFQGRGDGTYIESTLDNVAAEALMREAADEIERLRALLGAATVPGPSFADIRKTIKPEKGGQADG